MSYLFLLGRVLYGGFFIVAGINHFQHLGMMAGFAGMKGVPAPKLTVMFSGLLILVGGASILMGFQPALGIICIALFLIPVTFMMHTYWNDTDPGTKINNRVNFQKNVALLGAALMLVIVPQPWPLSVDASMSVAAQQASQAPGPMVKENATVKISDHEVLKALQGRVRELKAQGKTADETAQTLTAEFQAKYPGWTGPNRVGAAARAFYGEL